MHKLLDEMCGLAVQLATEAGEIAMARLESRTVAHKADESVVTDADHQIQAHILSAIGRRYPDHAVCAEETVALPGAHACVTDARYVWVIDPLDGTRNYVAGFPVFATAIGVLDKGSPVVGVVREHGRGDLYSAKVGGGAVRNGEPIRIRDQIEGADLLLGFASSKDVLTVNVIRHWAAMPRYVLRNTGSTAAQLALVAVGALAGAFARRVKLWDVAPASLLVLEAGGKITDPSGKPLVPFAVGGDPAANVPYVAGAPAIHDQLLASIRAANDAP
jgi:myo-inositol-1(or 4)-monophosphatase